MTALDNTLRQVQDEIRRKVTAIVPPDRAAPRFNTDAPNEPLPDYSELSGRTRFFRIEWTPTPERIGFGVYVRDWRVKGEIIIGYPAQADWNIAMMADFEAIYNVLNQNDHTNSSVAYRHVPDDSEPTIEDVEGDWRWMHVPIETHVSVS